jgi:guanylate cyclase
MTWSLSSLLDIGALPDDSEDLRLQKRMLMTVALLGLFVGFGWGTVYWILGETTAALIPGSYGVLTAVNILVYRRTKRYKVFRFTQMLFFLILPFALQLTLGGFVGASAVIIFGLFAPLGALVMQSRKVATRWMVAYISLLVASLIIQPAMTNDNSLSETVVGVLFIANIFGVASFTFIVMNYFVGQREMMQAALQREQEKSDNLLLNILPREVAADLKERGRTRATYYQSASVLFADQVGFTEFSGRTSPEDIVRTLNEIFTSFDEIVSRRDVEKIRTIGDAYMAAAGVPIEWDEHATAIVDAALDMQGFINTYDGIQFRIGVSSGPLVGGVVGTSKFQYDIWGDTVNVASRMESSGQPGRIQISDATYQLIKGEFECELRGEIEVKGKGAMTTWFVVARSN